MPATPRFENYSGDVIVVSKDIALTGEGKPQSRVIVERLSNTSVSVSFFTNSGNTPYSVIVISVEKLSPNEAVTVTNAIEQMWNVIRDKEILRAGA